MFKKFIGLLMLLLISVSNLSFAANIKDSPRVAVMNFGNKAITSAGLRDHDFSSATEYAIYQLSACGWFDLVDYEQLSTMAKIHSVNMSGLVDPSTAVPMGKFLGAQFIVVGNVTGLTTKENEFGYQHGNKGGINNAQHVVTANVAMRIVDVETGRIVVAGLGKGSSTSTHTEIVFKKYRNNQNNLAALPTELSGDGYGGGGDDEGTVSSSEAPMTSEGTDAGIQNTEMNPDDGINQGVSPESGATPMTENQGDSMYQQESEDYKITIGTVQVSDIQVRNAISKAVRDAIYGKLGLMTTLNNGKPLKIKTGF